MNKEKEILEVFKKDCEKFFPFFEKIHKNHKKGAFSFRYPSYEYVCNEVTKRGIAITDDYSKRGFEKNADLIIKATGEAMRDYALELEEEKRKQTMDKLSKITYLVLGGLIGIIIKSMWEKYV